MFSRFKIAIAAKYQYYASRNETKQFDSNGKPRIFLIDTPSHGNLGDHAIALAELSFLSDYFPEHYIFEICEDDFNRSILAIKQCIKSNDFVVLSGGGNFGDKYILDEKIRRCTVKNIRHNPVVIFPQTMDYSNGIRGRIEKIITKAIYASNRHLTICARESFSFQMMKKTFKNNRVIMAPDMALYLKQMLFKDVPHPVTARIILRNDSEVQRNKVKTNQFVSSLEKVAKEVGIVIVREDTVVGRQVSPEQRTQELENLFLDYSMADLILTDRLHGMILAAVSGTYCIVIPNSNHKIRGVYNDWLKSMNYIKFCSDINQAAQAINRIQIGKLKKYKYQSCKKEFDSFYNKLEDICKVK